MVEIAYNIIKDVARTLPRIAKWIFFGEENAVMWTLFVLVIGISANLMAYSFLQATPIKEHTGIILALLSPVWTLIMFRAFMTQTATGKDKAKMESIKELGELKETVRLKNGWLVGIYQVNNSFYVVPIEDVDLSEWRKFENLFRDLRIQKRSFDLEETRKLLTENF